MIFAEDLDFIVFSENLCIRIECYLRLMRKTTTRYILMGILDSFIPV